MNNNILLVSIPRFVVEYLKKDTENSFKYMCECVLKSLNNTKFSYGRKGNRTTLEGYINTSVDKNSAHYVPALFNILTSKVLLNNNTKNKIYSEELSIEASMSNEVFDVLLTDENGDIEEFRLLVESYDRETNYVVFLCV